MSGPFSQLLANGGLLPRVVPAFCRVAHGRLQERSDLREMFDTAAVMMGRRQREWTSEHAELFLALYEQTEDAAATDDPRSRPTTTAARCLIQFNAWTPRFPQSWTVSAPDGRTRRSTLPRARAYCRRLTLGHYENFSVASLLLPRRLLRHFHAVYAYCRWADDLADEAGGGERGPRPARLVARPTPRLLRRPADAPRSDRPATDHRPLPHPARSVSRSAPRLRAGPARQALSDV